MSPLDTANAIIGQQADEMKRMQDEIDLLQANDPCNRGLCEQFEDLLPPHPHDGASGLWLERLKTMREILKSASISLHYYAAKTTHPSIKAETEAVLEKVYWAIRAPESWRECLARKGDRS